MFAKRQFQYNLDSTLISAIRSGDQVAFNALFNEHYEALCRYASSILKDNEKAEDTVQQVFVNFWEKREKTIITGSIKAFLFKSVHNLSLNSIKHDKVVARYMEHSSFYHDQFTLAVEDEAIGNELQSRIQTSLEALPKQCGRIFKMNRFEEKKYKEIAAELDLSIKTVENQMGKALKLMRISLSDYLLLLMLMNL